ncbi:CRISPR system precrRNA processing endoribonuclease RAMP protein Cas6 [Rhodospirillum sp. A1_3_36]|uniref:CRISPR system precrRNA processing endoribonuclease RAMP protein Cas6 n=1 Tax=Rhodospirillum sp. A1_3_36 TaxID=3391666 RepID=UPI0039A6AF6D
MDGSSGTGNGTTTNRAPETSASPNPLRWRLGNPNRSVDSANLAREWFQSDIVLTLGPNAPDAVAGDPAVADRIRGALGRTLMESASGEAISGRPCPWSPPCALDILWGETGQVRRGVPIPKPFLIRVDAPRPGWLEIRLSLFGFATDWAEGIGDALVRTFRNGVSLEGGPHRRPFDPCHRLVETPNPAPCPPPFARSDDVADVSLWFITPVIPRRGNRTALDPLALLTGLSRRAEGMARWHDAALEVQGQALGEAARALRVDPFGLRPIAWTRPHTRNRSHDIPRSGFTGPYRLFGPSWALAEIQPLLTLGQAQGAGGHVALGLGQYRLIGPKGPSNSETSVDFR